jgi:drug/metabolite transporter (DMT)-like permease
MLNLALSILFSSLIFVIFKLFAIYRVQTLFGIIVNYVVACVVGLLFFDGSIDFSEIPEKSWFPGSLLLGALFIVVFNLMAKTSQKMGVSVASVATKMSLAIPVLFGVALYNEQLGPLKITGIVLALAAVYFSSVKESRTEFKKKELVLPLLVFLGSGIIDSSLKFLEETRVPQQEFPLFSATIFAAAAVTGIVFILLRSVSIPLRVNTRNLLGGCALGIPNFFSIYYILKALQNEVLNSASVFTVNNVAIVMLTTLLGIVLFREKISILNWSGIAMAVISIFLVALF